MEFKEQVANLSKRSTTATQKALTEEATKTSVVLPFIQILGFDPFNLDEVVPEYISDVGTKKGEKVDFALKINGETTILIEVKPITSSLGNAQYSQLYRYFGVTEAKLAILTNGKEAWFFSDIDAPNKMDKKPFFKFDFQKHSDDEIDELSRFQKDEFSIEGILEAASALKYSHAAAHYLKGQLDEPDDEFVKMVGRQIHDGMLTKNVVEQIRPAIQSALESIIRDRIQDRLDIAFRPKSETTKAEGTTSEDGATSDVITTEDELQAFMMVKAIAAKSISTDRVTIRDAKSYCSVFIDDNNRKPLCRFYFNSKSKNVLGLFNESKGEEKIDLGSLEDIYKYAEAIAQTAASYA
ncbi:type I restriction endonuclease [Celeribacter baekdonensis]|uniref:type I restriction endonuclease n=1 Tax=Celeribacter baekdonensis TaxID=875171 RepID=UPI0030D96B1D|tara:strand:+ start:47494 stop:48552 length:1059 start_codon:yes stop_codon:yes gene_type:complete